MSNILKEVRQAFQAAVKDLETMTRARMSASLNSQTLRAHPLPRIKSAANDLVEELRRAPRCSIGVLDPHGQRYLVSLPPYHSSSAVLDSQQPTRKPALLPQGTDFHPRGTAAEVRFNSQYLRNVLYPAMRRDRERRRGAFVGRFGK